MDEQQCAASFVHSGGEARAANTATITSSHSQPVVRPSRNSKWHAFVGGVCRRMEIGQSQRSRGVRGRGPLPRLDDGL
jgi:hypothetical protein